MRREHLFIAAAIVMGLMVQTFAFAQSHADPAALTATHLPNLKIDRRMLAGPLLGSLSNLPRVVQPDGISMIDQPREISLVGSTVMVEVARLTPDGKYARPRLVIGRQSHELKSFMSSIGIDAERCMLPMVRGRLKRNSDTGDVGATLYVSARCTFY